MHTIARYLPALFLLCLLAAPAHAADGDVPEAVQGKWVDVGEACDATGAPIVISATTLVYPDGTVSDLVFSPEENVIRIREEATNYEYIESDDRLVFHPEGFGMALLFPCCAARTAPAFSNVAAAG